MLTDRCNQNNNSYASFPTCYNTTKEKKYVNNQESYKMFSGATEGNKFRVEEYEVYRILYE